MGCAAGEASIERGGGRDDPEETRQGECRSNGAAGVMAARGMPIEWGRWCSDCGGAIGAMMVGAAASSVSRFLYIFFIL